jgi:hypothetical protein
MASLTDVESDNLIPYSVRKLLQLLSERKTPKSRLANIVNQMNVVDSDILDKVPQHQEQFIEDLTIKESRGGAATLASSNDRRHERPIGTARSRRSSRRATSPTATTTSSTAACRSGRRRSSARRRCRSSARRPATTRAGKECEIPNFKGSDLGRFPLVSADVWTSDHLSERSRSVGAVSGTRARGTLTLKRR